MHCSFEIFQVTLPLVLLLRTPPVGRPRERVREETEDGEKAIETTGRREEEEEEEKGEEKDLKKMKMKKAGRKEGVSGKSVVESAAGENHIHCPPPNQTLILCGSTSVGRSAAAATGGALPFSASGWLPPPPWPPSASGATVHRCQ